MRFNRFAGPFINPVLTWPSVLENLRENLIGWQLLIHRSLRPQQLMKLAKQGFLILVIALLSFSSLAQAQVAGEAYLLLAYILVTLSSGIGALLLLRGVQSATLPNRVRLVAQLACLVAMFTFSGMAVGQISPAPDLEQGLRAFGSYHGGDLDRISLSNGNLFFRANLLDYLQRAGEISYPIVLQYNGENFGLFQQESNCATKVCPMHVVFGPPWNVGPNSAGNAVMVGFEGAPTVVGTSGPGLGIDTGLTLNGKPIFVRNYSVLTADGSLHALANTDFGSMTLDGSGFRTDSSGFLRDSRGNKFGSVLEDANGNQISSSASTWTDTLGRQIPAMPGPSPAATPAASSASLSACPALGYSNQPVTYAYTWNLPTTNGGTLPLTLCYAGVWVRTGTANGPTFFDLSKNFTMLQSVVFPDNTFWAFQYDAADPNNTSSIGLADLLKVTLPTGGSISYTWGPCSCSTSFGRSVMTRSVDANDGNGAQIWHYSYSGLTTVNGNPTATRTVTDPLKNDAVHTLTGLGGFQTLYETQAQYFQGSQSSGTLLKTIKTDYQSTLNPYDSGYITTGNPSLSESVANVFPIRVTTTLPNGLVSKEETDYDTALTYHGPLDGIQYNDRTCQDIGGPTPYCTYTAANTLPVTNFPGSYGKVVAHREYDWGQGAPGALLRQTTSSYLWQSNSSYLSNNFLDLVSSNTLLDGSGNQAAQTTYGYDEYSLNSSGINTQHNSSPVNGSTRGNRTSVHRWLNGSVTSTATCSASVSNGFLVSYAVYNDTGTVFQSTDACGSAAGDKNHTTTHTYDSGTGAFPIQTCNPLAQCVKESYDFNTGLLTSLIDANGQTTNYSYDNRWRITQALFPPDPAGNHPETDFSYPNATTVQRTRKLTGNQNIVDYAYFDGLGRTKQTRLVDPQGDDFVDTTYDPIGRVSTVSNPHRSAGSTTDGITTNHYDALGRVTQTVKQDGSIASIAYEQAAAASSNTDCTLVTDEAGNPRTTCADAIGRLIEVDEPVAGSSSADVDATGSASVSGNEAVIPAVPAQGSITISGQPKWKTVSSSASTQTGGITSITVNGMEQQWPVGVTSGAATIGFTGTEQVLHSKPGTGSVTITGNLQSKQVLATAATKSTGYVTINATGNLGVCDDSGNPNGTMTISVGSGAAASVAWGCSMSTGTTSQLAAALASQLNGSYISAWSSGATVYFQSQSTGNSTNYSISADDGYGGYWYVLSASGGAMSNGKDATYNTVYDSGSCTITANSHGDSKSWSGSGTAAAAIAGGLVSSINSDTSASVNASVPPGGNIVTLTARTLGASTNYALSSSCTYDSSNFGGPSFTISNSGSALTGGTDIYDAGTFTLTVNNSNPPYTVSWGQGDTPNTIAANLVKNINTVVTGGPVTASLSGSTAVTLTAKTSGGISNYPFTVTASYDSKDFSKSSFAASAPGSALAGGAPPVIAYDSGLVTVSVNGKQYQATWGASDTPLSIASKLVSAIGADGAVTPSQAANGNTMYLTAKTPATLYTSSTTYAFDTAQTGHFAQSSFAPANAISDWGTMAVTVNNHPDSVPWSGLDTPKTIATALAGKINGDSAASVMANSTDGVVSLTALTGGVSSDYNFSSSLTSLDATDFSPPSFSSSSSGTALAGGKNAIYDNGTISLAVGGFTAQVPYGQGSTAQSVAQALAAALSAPSSSVKASSFGAGLTITATAGGAGGDYPLSWSSSTSQSSTFSQPSFGIALSGGTLDGGANPLPSGSSSAMVTLYSNDVLGNLICVEQHGNVTGTGCNSPPSNDATSPWRVRRFSYDSLSRILTASNPESGQISYSYDADGNLLQKTSPAANQPQGGTATQTISYCYDVLNRITGKAYSAQGCPLISPVVTNAYDSGTNGIGRLTSWADQAGSGSYTYDALGRIATEQRTISGVQKSLSYTYNLDNSIATLKYPSGAVITYTPDSAGRMVSAVDLGNSISYATGATYGATSSLTGFISGNSISSSFSYNNRLQPTNILASTPTQTLFTLSYNFHLGNGDNGNVFGITNNRDNARSKTFTYDALNRLISAQNAGTDCTQKTLNGGTKYWGNSYGYDAWGNLISKTPTKCSAENLGVMALSNNRLSGYGYDAAGNMTLDVTSGNIYGYDPENRIAGAAGFTYTYDADGNRVEKSNGSTGTIYWSMSPGIVAESDLSGNLKSEYVFFNGKRVARKDFSSGATSVAYYFSDHLGTASVITNSAGTITEDEDFYPWGLDLPFVNTDSNKYKYGGHELDSETGAYNYGARYYSPALGRYLTPDWAAKPITIPYANFGNPQSLNLYRYALNNPTTLGDPDGHCDLCWTFAQWVGKAVSFSGSVKQAAKDTAIGVAKGTGNFLVNTVKTGAALSQAAQGNAIGAMNTLMTPNPKPLHPSNQVQADASKTTQLTLGVASVVAPMAAGSSVGAAGGVATETTSLFRAVMPAEAESINSLGAFTNPLGVESKFFSTSIEGAQSYASQATQAFGDGPFSFYSTEMPTSAITPEMTVNVDRGIDTVVVPTDKLPQLSTPKPMDPR